MKQILNILLNVTAWILAVCVLFSASVLFVPRLFGMNPYVVLSGSMEPEISTGSLVYIKDTKETYEPGDVVAFHTSDLLVVHRIYAYGEDGTFITKGDSNEHPDGRSLDPSDILGECIFTIPGAGYLVSMFQSQTIQAGGLSVPVPAVLASGVLLALSLLGTMLDSLDGEKKHVNQKTKLKKSKERRSCPEHHTETEYGSL